MDALIYTLLAVSISLSLFAIVRSLRKKWHSNSACGPPRRLRGQKEE